MRSKRAHALSIMAAILLTACAFDPPHNTSALKLAAANQQIAILAQSLQKFRADHGRYPTVSEGLAALRPTLPLSNIGHASC